MKKNIYLKYYDDINLQYQAILFLYNIYEYVNILNIYLSLILLCFTLLKKYLKIHFFITFCEIRTIYYFIKSDTYDMVY